VDISCAGKQKTDWHNPKKKEKQIGIIKKKKTDWHNQKKTDWHNR